MAPKPAAKQKPEFQTPPPAEEFESDKPTVEDLFQTLDRHAKARHYDEVISTADQILSELPGDVDALLCKVVALIQDDKFDDAIAVIDSNPNLLPSLSFHKAYCLYKKNMLQDGLEMLKDLEKTEGVLQLEAQILYRLCEFDSCSTTYQTLASSNVISTDTALSELKTNLMAAYISGGRSNDVPGLMESMKISPKASYDLAYNTACALIDQGNYAKAEEHLLLARRIGQEALIEEECTNEEIDNELAPISVQLAYVQQLLGRTSEAIDAYNGLLKQKLEDAPSMAVASNNLIVLRGNKELSDSIRKLDSFFQKKNISEQGLLFLDGLEHKLSVRQKESIAFNRCVALLLANKIEQVRELVPMVCEKFPNSCIPPILHASLLVREGKLTRAEELLAQYVEKHPNNKTPLLLAKAQVATQAGHYKVASQALEQISELQHTPGMVATLVALKERAGDINGAEAILDEAVQWWENHMDGKPDVLELIAKEAANFKLNHKNLLSAALLFQKLAKSSSAEVRAEALSGLVYSMAPNDIGKAEEYEQQLPPMTGLSNINVDSLEQEGTSVVGGKRPLGLDDLATGDAAKPKRRRKRRPRYPKGFDPENPGPPPDPERWLPLRERSTYRPRRRDKRAQMRGSQGSVSKSAPTTTTNGPAANSGKAPAGNTDSGKAASGGSSKSKKKSRR